MGEISLLIQKVKTDKEFFYLLIERMAPLIKKYEKLLYLDEKEDVHSELVLALWEAVCRMEAYENDGQIVKYLSTGLRNKFYELYRNSRKIHDHTISEYEENVFLAIAAMDNQYNAAILKKDIESFLKEFTGRKKEIFYLILVKNLSDSEIAGRLEISRQYVHRMRKELQKLYSNT